MSNPLTTPNGAPWYVKVFREPVVLANVVAYGATLLLLYTAGWEWPRQAERFQARIEEQRDMGREVLQLQRENQRLLLRLENGHQQQLLILQGIQKVLTEMWLKMQAARKE